MRLRPGTIEGYGRLHCWAFEGSEIVETGIPNCVPCLPLRSPKCLPALDSLRREPVSGLFILFGNCETKIAEDYQARRWCAGAKRQRLNEIPPP
jgi:hypothetical protein